MNSQPNSVEARFALLEQRCLSAESGHRRATQRGRTLALFAVVLIAAAILLAPSRPMARAQGNGNGNGIPGRVAALEAAVQNLQTALTAETNRATNAEAALQTALTAETNRATNAEIALQGADTTQNGQIAALQATMHFVTVAGNEMYIIGANLHILNGLGSTDQINGLGNLIVGYNALRGDGSDARTGSHNVIGGDNNNYSSFGGLVVGQFNTISNMYASVSGGYDNTASNGFASVSGGQGNIASGGVASVSGGYHNTASSTQASVSGGRDNIASGSGSSVSGGQLNIASFLYASVSGGYHNIASGDSASVSGGSQLTQNNTNGWSGGSLGGLTFIGKIQSP